MQEKPCVRAEEEKKAVTAMLSVTEYLLCARVSVDLEPTVCDK